MRLPMRMAIAIVFATIASSRVGHAEPAARFVYLRGKGTESCPSEVDVRQAVEQRLGYDPFSSYAVSTMLAEVATDGAGFMATLKFVDGDNGIRGGRELKVQGKCTDLMEAMALTISIAIDPMSVTRNGPPADAPPTEKPVTPLANLPATTAKESDSGVANTTSPSEAPAKSDQLMMSASLGPLATLGSEPALAVGGALSVDAQLDRLVLGIEGRADAPASASAGSLGRVQSSLAMGSIFGGIREGVVSLCAVGSLGRLAATSSDVLAAHDQSALFAAAGFFVGVGIPISNRVELRARAELLANLAKHTLTISGEKAYEYPIGSGNLGVSVAVRFW